MKKYLLILMIAISVVLVFTSCRKSSASSNQSTDLLETVKERGSITVATEGTWAPWTYHDENNNLVGYDIEVAKGIARALGITEAVVSPTFTLVQEYEGNEKLYHLDLYRLSGEDEFESMGGEEFLYPDGITLVEWAEKIGDMMRSDAFFVTITINDDESREITIEGGNHEYSCS